MKARTGRRGLVALLGLAALAAACTPVGGGTPSTTTTTQGPVAVLCPSSAPPGPEDKFAVVDPDAGAPTVVTFEATTQAEVDQEVAQLEVGGTVLAVSQDQAVSALTVTPGDDTFYSGQYGATPSQMDLEVAWNTNNVDGTGVRVAIIDSGVQASHTDLDDNVVPGKDYITPTNDGTVDGNGHGTHVAGIIAAEDNTEGVVGGAPHATIVPVRVLDCGGSGNYSDVASGILWASDPSQGDADVLNISLGGFSPDSGLLTAVQTAVNTNGAVVVAAAGNCGHAPANCGNQQNRTIYPGSYDEVISVGSTDATGAKSNFSNNNTYIDVAAPGSSIPSTWPANFGQACGTVTLSGAYRCLSGTSMATPQVSALAALLLDCTDLALTPAQVKARIVATAGPAISGFAGPVGLAKAGAATTPPCTP